MAEEVSNALEQIKSWSAPILMSVIAGLVLFIWNGLEKRTAALEVENASYRSALATITENQRNSAENRTEFQNATTTRLNRMEDVLVTLSNNISALTAIQAERVSR